MGSAPEKAVSPQSSLYGEPHFLMQALALEPPERGQPLNHSVEGNKSGNITAGACQDIMGQKCSCHDNDKLKEVSGKNGVNWGRRVSQRVFQTGRGGNPHSR